MFAIRHSATRRSPLSTSTAHAFAEFALPAPWGYILLEVDEEQRKAYDPSCDVRRDFNMAASVALGSGHKLLVLRYNPDAFKIAGMTRRTTKKERRAQLIRLLGELLARKPEAPFTRLFFSTIGPWRTARCPASRSTGPSPCAPSPAAPRVQIPRREAGRRVRERYGIWQVAPIVLWETLGQSCLTPGAPQGPRIVCWCIHL